ncbi:MAG: hypothetical protein ABII82_09140 [Verrucomicrobiota bacterium]
MKSLALALCLCGLATAGLAAQTIHSSGGQAIRLPDINVSSELADLAKGHAKAFESIERRPVNIVLKIDDGRIPKVLLDVTRITAFGGAVRIELRSGLNYVISADDVLAVTDDSRVKP